MNTSAKFCPAGDLLHISQQLLLVIDQVDLVDHQEHRHIEAGQQLRYGSSCLFQRPASTRNNTASTSRKVAVATRFM